MSSSVQCHHAVSRTSGHRCLSAVMRIASLIFSQVHSAKSSIRLLICIPTDRLLLSHPYIMSVSSRWRTDDSLQSTVNETPVCAAGPLLLLLLLLLRASRCKWRRVRLVVSIAVGRCVRVAMTTGYERSVSYGVVQCVVDLQATGE